MKEVGFLDDKFIIKNIISKDGSFSIVYLVEDKSKNKIFAAKVIEEEINENQIINEAELLLYLSNKSPYIINLIDKGKGKLIVKGETQKILDKRYIIIEYCSNGMLLNYTLLIEKGFEELLSKVIFEKILKGVQAIHNSEIVHLDLKNDNIFIDEKYNLKIADFGVSIKKSEQYDLKKLKIITGSEEYNSPQVNFKKVYNGYKNDIFSLGIILFSLITGQLPFENKSEYTKHMKNIEEFLEIYEKTNNLTFSPEFKKLFQKMVSAKENKRPSIDEILKDKWFEEIRNMNEEQINKLNKNLINEYSKREKDIKKELGQNIEANNGEENEIEDSRGIGEDKTNFFTSNDLPEPLKNENNIDYFIIIKGKIRPYSFMNSLGNILNEKYLVEKSKIGLELDIIKESEENEEECELEIDEGEDLENENIEENEENQDILSNNLIIRITLYEKSKEEYLLKFFKISGEWMDFFDNFKSINTIVKNYLTK